MVTRSARAALGLPAMDVAVGDAADIVVLGVRETAHALGGSNLSRSTIKDGRLVCSVDVSVTRHHTVAPD